MSRINRSILGRCLVGLSLLTLAVPSAQAATALSFAPISLKMVGNQRATSLTLRNVSDQTASFRLELNQWTQNGEDLYAPTRDLIVNPSGFTLTPGQEQTIRIARRGNAADTNEHAYRVFIQELPPQAVDGPDGSVKITTLYRLSLPLMLSAVGAAPKLSFALERSSDGLAVVASNSGNLYTTLTDVELSVDGQKLEVPSFNLLGGGSMRFAVSGAAPTTAEVGLQFTQNQAVQQFTLRAP
ncbi:fimbrial biogenesis chaperone [Deinococcus rubellus]|uniref:Fimbria/pilus periplasmic chaperone n=1 Tax=Deinococcus rubellus TaxID=1889240 RepID=A0ABY5YJR2_9DEIO|nr:fimbria/pilus periplasmic chaperone [Deinococcus rubellus]UWX64332.1 fimbria/pilus periplasmic chaperone [Deinococcus rubellus]